jgi:L-rhamnose isomerase/sugar isomerase
MVDFKADYERLADRLASKSINVEQVKARLKQQHIETPSWGYGNGGTRFKVFAWPGAARTIWDKVEDAAYIHKLTGIAPSMAVHIPWDKVDDYEALGQYAREQGISIGAVNPNYFQDDIYKLGSFCNPSPSIREEAMAHTLECIEIMPKVGSNLLSLWFADGTNYAGQDSIVRRKRDMEAALIETHKHLPKGSRMLIEYKFFEPAFYHTDLADWGMSYAMALKCGPQAQVLVDTGHHAQGTNIAHIVAFLLDEGRLGGFHLNARRYADDDLIVGTNNPYELFEIYCELVSAGEAAQDVAYMIDQSHNIEPKIEAMLLSVVNCQVAYARALIVDYNRLHQMQAAGDVLGAQQIMVEAFDTDVRPLLMQARTEMDIPADPIAAYRADDYARRVADKRGTNIQAASAIQ